MSFFKNVQINFPIPHITHSQTENNGLEKVLKYHFHLYPRSYKISAKLFPVSVTSLARVSWVKIKTQCRWWLLGAVGEKQMQVTWRQLSKTAWPLITWFLSNSCSRKSDDFYNHNATYWKAVTINFTKVNRLSAPLFSLNNKHYFLASAQTSVISCWRFRPCTLGSAHKYHKASELRLWR
jgi:hypothetical protein